MKKIVMAVLFIFALSSVAFASPLTDFSKGKAALDINYRVSPDYDKDSRLGDHSINSWAQEELGIRTNFDGDSNVEWGFTYGIGNNWALQYRQATPKGNLTLFDGNCAEITGYTSDKIQKQLNTDIPIPDVGVTLESKTRVEEYNVMYKLDKNFSLFTGIAKATPSTKLNVGLPVVNGDGTIQGHDKNIWQFGVVAVKPLNKDFTTYGIAGFGSDYRNLEVGLGYKIAKDLEFNVNYRDMKIDDMKVANATLFGENFDLTTDTQIKGWGFGVTYNF